MAFQVGAFQTNYQQILSVNEQPQGKGSGASRKKRRGLYDDVDIPKVGFFEQPKIGDSDKPPAKSTPDKEVKSDLSKKTEKPYMTAMAEAFEKAGVVTPEQFIREQEAIDRRRKLNMAALILLLD